MIVMNDRSQAGSAFRQGRIELMFNRRGSTQDDLGMPEPVDDKDASHNPVTTHNRYYVAFTNDREQAFKTIFRKAIG